jgi:hypothetical protein
LPNKEPSETSAEAAADDPSTPAPTTTTRAAAAAAATSSSVVAAVVLLLAAAAAALAQDWLAWAHTTAACTGAPGPSEVAAAVTKLKVASS